MKRKTKKEMFLLIQLDSNKRQISDSTETLPIQELKDAQKTLLLQADEYCINKIGRDNYKQCIVTDVSLMSSQPDGFVIHLFDQGNSVDIYFKTRPYYVWTTIELKTSFRILVFADTTSSSSSFTLPLSASAIAASQKTLDLTSISTHRKSGKPVPIPLGRQTKVAENTYNIRQQIISQLIQSNKFQSLAKNNRDSDSGLSSSSSSASSLSSLSSAPSSFSLSDVQELSSLGSFEEAKAENQAKIEADVQELDA